MKSSLTLTRIQNKLQVWLSHILQQKWFDVGLRAKMGLLVTIGLVGLIAAFAFMGINTARQVTHQVLGERMMIARLSAATLDSVLRHLHTQLEILAHQYSQHPTADGGQPHLDTAPTFSKGLVIIGKNGEVLLSSNGQADTLNGLSISWRRVPAVQNALGGSEFNLSLLEKQLYTSSKPGAQPVSRNQVLAVLAVPVRDSSGKAAACLAAVVDLTTQDLFPLDRSIQSGGESFLDVVDSSGRVLISSIATRTNQTIDNLDVINRLFIEGKPGVETCLGCSGEADFEVSDEVIAFAPLQRVPWGVVVQQRSQEAFAPVHKLTFQNLLLGLVIMVGALGLVWVTTNSVIKPIQLLTSATRQIADGDLDISIEGLMGRHYHKDEIGTLAGSLNTMKVRLKQSIREIQDWNQELDARVKERTQAAIRAQMEAQAARDDLRAIIDALSDELIVVGVEDHRIHLVNRAAHDRHASDKALLGATCYEAMKNGHNCQTTVAQCPIPAVVHTGKPVRVEQVIQCDPPHQTAYYEMMASPMRDQSGIITRIVELKRDVTEEKRIKESLVRRNQQLSILNAISTTVNQSLDLKDILGRALDEVLQVTGIDVGAVFLQSDLLGEMELMAYRGLSEEAARLAAQMGMLDGSCGGILEQGQVIVVPDLSRYRGKRARSLQREQLSTLVHIPLTAKGCTLGSMCVGTRRSREFSPDEQDLFTSIGNQIAVAVENARLYAEVQHKEHIRGELFKKAINAQEDERKRIARDLHDDTSQSLTALLYACEEAQELDDLAEIKDMLASMRELSQHTLDGVHKIMYDLRPSTLDHLGLVPALRWWAKSLLEPRGVRVSIEEINPIQRLPPEVETALFRVVQEAITNISRHAAARNTCISLNFEGNTVSITIEDDGVGFDTGELNLSPDSSQGLGLMGMRERLELLGGSLEINTSPGNGTQIFIETPIRESEPVYE